MEIEQQNTNNNSNENEVKTNDKTNVETPNTLEKTSEIETPKKVEIQHEAFATITKKNKELKSELEQLKQEKEELINKVNNNNLPSNSNNFDPTTQENKDLLEQLREVKKQQEKLTRYINDDIGNKEMVQLQQEGNSVEEIKEFLNKNPAYYSNPKGLYNAFNAQPIIIQRKKDEIQRKIDEGVAKKLQEMSKSGKYIEPIGKPQNIELDEDGFTPQQKAFWEEFKKKIQ